MLYCSLAQIIIYIISKAHRRKSTQRKLPQKKFSNKISIKEIGCKQ
nr:MAG TPA: hypothetical protein [Caudoviricetes sp.]